MRLVLLTSEGLEHRYLAGVLASAFPDELAAIIVARAPAKPIRVRARTVWRRYSLRQLLSRLVARAYTITTGAAARRAATMRSVLFPDGDDGTMPASDRLHVVPSHNGPACLALLQQLAPDVIAVYGTAIIKSPVIRMARQGVLNMHTGISPRYRGADTIFWPLHNEEPEWVGVTVHILDEGIDSGPIIAIGRPDLAPNDDEPSLFAKAVRVGSALYVDAVRAVADGRAAPVPQDAGIGREYRFVDRTMAAERRVARLLREGLLRRPSGTP